ncbi:hypothetical protein BASA81_003521 [Batrachochytrium salamandrivorans]|nr:hypothetical protein BASA81_003521 [Batrachochytrium salamandrivorans]
MPQDSLAKLSLHPTGDDKQCFAVLTSKHKVSRDTIHLDFEYPSGVCKTLPVGKHLKVLAPNPCKPGELWNGEEDEDEGEPQFERKYTPCTVTERGFVLIVKVYSPNKHFPQGGKMSQYLDSVRVGDHVEFSLPYGVIEYLGKGEFQRIKNMVKAEHIGMIAAGSGITPMLRLLEASLGGDGEGESVKYSLLFANRELDDIICKQRLDELAAKYPTRFTVTYILSQPNPEWQGLRGRAHKQLLAELMPSSANEPLILCCGPPAMVKTCCKESLNQLGYDAKRVWDF